MSVVVVDPAATRDLTTLNTAKRELAILHVEGLSVQVVATARTFARTTGGWINDGVKVGQRITFSGFTNAGNNNAFEVESVEHTHQFTVKDPASLLVNEGPTASIVAQESGSNPLISYLISEASVAIPRFLNYELVRERVTERLTGTGRFRLMLSRTPLLSVQQVRFDDGIVLAADYAIQHREAGFLFKRDTWTQVRRLSTGIEPIMMVEHGEEQWEVDYLGGFYLPSFASLTGTITGATAANPVVLTSTAHGLQTGDRFVVRSVGGMTEINDRIFTVTKVDDNSLSLDAEDGTSHTAYTTGGAWAVTPQLPLDIEQAAVNMVMSRFHESGRDPGLTFFQTSELSLKFSETTTGVSGVPDTVTEQLAPYQRAIA